MALYVPFSLEIMLCNRKNRKENEIALSAPDYSHLTTEPFLGDRIEPMPFARGNVLKQGAHLHFILPDAFTHSVEKKGSFYYPALPNRWLVTRLASDEKTIKAKSWIIESDYVGLDNKNSITIPELDYAAPYKRLGRCYELGQKKNDQEETLNAFYVTVTGNPVFASYYPDCQSVLGFYDPLDDIDRGSLTYFAAGFYSELKNDPLYELPPEEWNAFLAEREWSVPEGSTIQERLICHSVTHTVNWKGPDADYDTAAPAGEVHIAMGNTSVEALSALIVKKLEKKKNETMEGLERFLNVLQYSLFDEFSDIDGISTVEALCHEYAYAKQDGGVRWQIVKNSSSDNPKPLPEGAGALFNTLQRKQEAYHKKEREILSDKDRLFGAWYIFAVQEKENESIIGLNPSDVEKEINRLLSEIERQTAEKQQMLHEIADAKRKLDELLGTCDGDYIIEEEKLPVFFQPKDPVLLLAGDGVKRSFAFGEDGRFNKDGTMSCRTDTIQKLKGAAADHTEIILTADDILSYCEFLLPDCLDAEIYKKVLCEAVCLSPVLTNWLARQKKAESLTPEGILPSKIAVSTWEQSWTTLFMEWELSFHPTRTNSQKDNSMDNWEYEDIDYHYTAPVSQNHSNYTGRTVITPHSVVLLKSVLEKSMEQFQDDPELYQSLKEMVKYVDTLAVVSQSAGNFGIQTLGRNRNLQLPILSGAESQELCGKVRTALTGHELCTVKLSYPFYPVRAGHVMPQKINIINTFGQQEILDVRPEDIVYSELMEAYENYGTLAPRLTQGARLVFEWVSRTSPQVLSSLDSDTSPICGYLIPDMLNHNVMVCDSDGSYLGILKRIYRKQRPIATWISAPGLPETFEQIAVISQQLKKFVTALLDYSERQDAAFPALMQLIDRRIATDYSQVNPDDLSALWGRPLVLARASVRMELYGKPFYSPAIKDFAKYQTYGFENISFPVHVGDAQRVLDGTVGYFMDNDKGFDGRCLYAAYQAKKTETATEYIKYDCGLRLQPDGKEHLITLLMEAGTDVNLFTGILPGVRTKLNAEYTQNQLQNLHLAAAVNPVLSNRSNFMLPLPDDGNFSWHFAFYEEGARKEITEISNPEAVFPDTPLSLLDGYLIREGGKKT